MPHPIDAIVREYHKTLDELHNVYQSMRGFDALHAKKADLESRLDEMRKQLAGHAAGTPLPTAELPSVATSAKPGTPVKA